MNEVIFQKPDEQCWLGQDHVVLEDVFKVYLKHSQKILSLQPEELKKSSISEQEVALLTNSQEAVQQLAAKFNIVLAEIAKNNLKSTNYSYYQQPDQYWIFYPQSRTTNQIQNAYLTQTPDIHSKIKSLLEPVEIIEQFFKIYKPQDSIFYRIYQHGGKESYYYTAVQDSNPYLFFQHEEQQGKHLRLAEALHSLEKKLKKTPFAAVVRSTENSFIQKKAWAVFATSRDNKTSGYIGKNGELGDISAARIFDSDKGAKRSKGYHGGWEVVEIEVSLKQRMQFNPEYQNEQLNAALAILEKQKIEQFFKEVSIEKIQAKMKELENHIQNSDNSTVSPNTSTDTAEPIVVHKKHKI